MTDSQRLPDSLWQLKPWWCQPWSIVLTGVAMPTAVWLWLHRLWIVIPLSVGVLLWWVVFLYLAPKQYTEFVRASKEQS